MGPALTGDLPGAQYIAYTLKYLNIALAPLQQATGRYRLGGIRVPRAPAAYPRTRHRCTTGWGSFVPERLGR
jgi:hypothetical protein